MLNSLLLDGHVFRCKCSLQTDRHLVAAWNVASKPQCALLLAAKATYEAFKAKVERIVNVNYPTKVEL